MAFADLKNDFVFRRIFGQAKWAEGKVEGKVEAVLAVLVARGLAVGREVRARIEACKDAATLDRWLVRAVTAEAAEDVLAEPG